VFRNFKKARPMRRRRRSSRSNNFTSQKGGGGGLTFRARKVRARQYRHLLWNDTLFSKHYRSLNGTTNIIGTPASQVLATVETTSALRFSANNFWTSGGGAINPDGGAIPTFATNDDITIRGGKIALRLCNTLGAAGTTESLDITVFLIRSKSIWNPAVPTSVSVMWDPSLVPDFQTSIGKIVMQKKFLLQDTEVANVEYRLKIQKIDQTEYTGNANTYMWMMVISNPDSANARSVQYTASYSLSFVSDAV
jgi:hypothetical protein